MYKGALKNALTVIEILDSGLLKTLTWIMTEK